MKGKLSYVLLAGGVLVMIVGAACLTYVLFELSIPDVTTPDARSGKAGGSPAVAETVIEVGTQGAQSGRQRPEAGGNFLAVGAHAARVESAKPGGSAGGAASAGAEAEAIDKPGIGEVVLIQGEAYAFGADQKRRSLTLKSRVMLNETVETGPDSRLRMEFDDGSVVAQGENSLLLLDEYVYDPQDAENCRFSARFLRGVCRVITGLITEANPRRFTIRTRMATIGIRGCTMGFRSMADRDDIYVFELPEDKSIHIDTTRDGSNVMDPGTGKAVQVAADNQHEIIVTKPRVLVSVVRGRGASESGISVEQYREIMDLSSFRPSARYELHQSPDQAVFKLQPKERTAAATPEE